jgi:hypothetical protein
MTHCKWLLRQDVLAKQQAGVMYIVLISSTNFKITLKSLICCTTQKIVYTLLDASLITRLSRKLQDWVLLQPSQRAEHTHTNCHLANMLYPPPATDNGPQSWPDWCALLGVYAAWYHQALPHMYSHYTWLYSTLYSDDCTW